MTLDNKYSLYRKISIATAFVFLMELCIPTAAWALTGGPSQPEFSSFEPVATTNMVDVFSGDLTYNLPVISIPGSDGGGYAMSLSYHSGASPEEEASWVGYGWTLSPGAINRNKRGFPDDWKSESVTYYNKAKPNRTISLGIGLHPELFSSDDLISVSLNASVRFNNYRGFGYNAGIGLALGKGVVSLGYNVADGEGSYSLALNPANALRYAQKSGKEGDKKSNNNETKPKADSEAKANKKAGSQTLKGIQKSGIGSTNLIGSNYGIFSYAHAERATNVISYSGKSYNVSVGATVNPAVAPIGGSAELVGTYSKLTNDPTQIMPTYGYMYSGDTNKPVSAMMDYYTEKNTPYQKNDRFIGIPFGNPDNFNVTGEGIGGGFRLYHRHVGQFFPNTVSNHTEYFNVGAALDVGTNIGGGADIDAGDHYLLAQAWSGTNDFLIEGQEDEPYFFRFNQDMSGYIDYGSSIAQQAVLSGGGDKGKKEYNAVVSGINRVLNGGQRNTRSTFVGYNTNAEITSGVQSSNYYRAYAKETANDALIDRSKGNLIGEFSITNEDGQIYNYGLPVHSRNERQIQMGLEGLSGSNLQNMYLAYKHDDISSNKTYTGEVRNAPYATSYLLTSIVTPDFIDRTNDGPTQDDFGGYTKFVYKKKYGKGVLNEAQTAEKWYRWRIPYRGLLYQRNSLSDASDDQGTYTSGEKEIYYLDSIKTKTHFAVFHTSARLDGLGALPQSTASSSKSGTSPDQLLQKLDKIELYANNNGNPKLIRTVHFSYDYSLCSGVPNNVNGSGKLTLKKVWFEHEGIVQTKISPYKFTYSYPQVTYPGKYSNLDMYTQFSPGLSASAQNPNYSPFMLDAWGNYQSGGAARFTNMQHWVDQGNTNANTTWDPAAWQLKVIKLPSGGEIHVQYEADDYHFVQDRRAMGMVSLKSYSGNKHYLDLSDLGSGVDEDLLVALMHRQFVSRKERIYFKFLYNLSGTTKPSMTHCNAEYITGYAKVASVGKDAGGVFVTLSSSGTNGSPDKVCDDFVRTQRAGRLSSSTNCDPDDGIKGTDAIEIVRWFSVWAWNLFKPSQICSQKKESLSYLRIPLVDAKRGGGVRVKRLLMYDEGIETGDAALYGSEYIYQHYDEELGRMTSSGVATNEPASIREENALIKFMERFSGEPGWLNKVIAGKDRETSEGPLGETLLPGPSVGYSKVYIKNIHSGLTNPGFTVHEFYTAKDYPFKYEMTSLAEQNDHKSEPYGVYNSFLSNLWMTQGFSFKLYNFHGKLKYQAAYAGNYQNMFSPEKNALISLTEHRYYEPEESIPVMEHPKKTVLKPLGKEMDIAMESKMVGDYNYDTRMEFDGTMGMAVIPIPFFFEIFSYTNSEMELYTHATSKITRYPAVEKGLTTFKDGMYRTIDYLAFDKYKGKPLVTKRRDGFNKLNLLASANHKGDYYDYSIPASYSYKGMGPKGINERRLMVSGVTDNVTMKKYSSGTHFAGPIMDLSGAGSNVCKFMEKVSQGDFVEVFYDNSGTIKKELYHLGDVQETEIELLELSYGVYGQIPSGTTVDMQVLRSGKSNQLNAVAGTFTTYGNNLTSNTLYNSQLAERQQVATALNNYMNSNPPFNHNGGLNATSFANGLNFINFVGNCDTLDSNYFIRLENDSLKMYHKSQIQVIGNHPFVDQLNNYLDDYLNYKLCTGGTIWTVNHTVGSPYNYYAGCQACTSMSVVNTPPEPVESIDFSTCPDLQTMRSQQISDLSTTFAYVNDQVHSVDDFFRDIDLPAGNSITVPGVSNPSDRINKRVLLELLSGGNMFGVSPTKNIYPGTFWIPGTYGDVDWLPVKTGSGMKTGNFAGSTRYFYAGYDWGGSPTNLPASLTGAGFFLPLAGGVFSQTSNGYLTWIPSQDIAPGTTALAEDTISSIRFFRYKVICSVPLDLSGGGTFDIDQHTGALKYYPASSPCNGISIPCLEFCDEESAINQAQHVIKAEISTYHDEWDFDETDYAPFSATAYANDYELGKKGQYRIQSNYVYRTSIKGLDEPFTAANNNKIYNSGTYTMRLFDFSHIPANEGTPWLKVNEVTRYSPNGNALEEEDILGIKSAAKFGYDKTLPYLIVKNGDYASSYFESFENTYNANTYLEDVVLLEPGGSISSATAHSGANCYAKSGDVSQDLKLFSVNGIPVSDQLATNGLLIKVWVKNENIQAAADFDVNGTPFQKVASRGEWSLYEAHLTSFAVDPADIILRYYYNSSHTVYIDDVRIQPADAAMSCYVYDVNTHRLSASFDDQHFGLYYQYNAEGKLVRKIKETERGFRTIQEMQYHQPKWENRPY